MYVMIHHTCGDCDRYKKDKNWCEEWAREKSETSLACGGAEHGLFSVNFKPIPTEILITVRELNRKLMPELKNDAETTQ